MAFAAVVSVMSALSACGSGSHIETHTPSVTPSESAPGGHTPNPVDLSLLQSNREKWAASEVADYQFGFSMTCFCPQTNQPATILVRDNHLVSVSDSSGTPLTTGYLLDTSKPYSTADRIFAEIENLLSSADQVTVVYAGNGFPTRIAADPIEDAVDDEFTVTISDFQALQ